MVALHVGYLYGFDGHNVYYINNYILLVCRYMPVR